jgi:FkbM family methyltransferase
MVRGRDIATFENKRCAGIRLGNKGARWTVDPTKLPQSPTVYSFGIGTDISWDLKMIQNYKCQVHAFDPSPKSLEWLETQQIPDAFKLYNYGLGQKDGNISFYLPKNNNHVSGSILTDENLLKDKISVPVKSFFTIVSELRHTKIDVLKMDIEGAEYQVLDDILVAPITINQILIEFHHRMFGYHLNHTREAVHKIKNAGYGILDISRLGEEYSFIRN